MGNGPVSLKRSAKTRCGRRSTSGPPTRARAPRNYDGRGRGEKRKEDSPQRAGRARRKKNSIHLSFSAPSPPSAVNPLLPYFFEYRSATKSQLTTLNHAAT